MLMIKYLLDWTCDHMPIFEKENRVFTHFIQLKHKQDASTKMKETIILNYA